MLTTKMLFKELYRFEFDCISMYAKFDKLEKQYTIKVDDLPDFVQHQFAGLIMSYDDVNGSGCEGAGADNSAFDHTMLPSLLNLLKDSTDRDNEIEFVNTWKGSVTQHYKKRMQAYLDDACREYNSERGLCA